MCVLLTHSMVRTRSAGGDVVHIERRAPQRPAALVGHATGCWRQLVDTWTVWGSNASSAGVSHALTLEECRFSGWVPRPKPYKSTTELICKIK
jgi:hypothetical protein